MTPRRDPQRQIAPAERAPIDTQPSCAAATVADRQHGVVARAQLVTAGLSGSAISRWAQAGRLQRLHRGVYAFGHRQLRREGWWTAALLAAGPGALLSHWTAALCWSLLAHSRTTIDIIPADRSATTARGVRVHRCALHDDDRRRHEGFPVTSVARTIVDLAGEATDRQIGAMLDEAVLLHLYDHRAMMAAIDRAHGRPGMRRLTAAVALLSEDGERFRSSTERDVRDRLRAAGFPRALINADRVLADGSRHELDLWWPQQRLNVEIDGPRHRLPHQRALDRARDRKLAAEGVQVVRVPVEDIDAHFATVAAEIAWRLGCVTLSAR